MQNSGLSLKAKSQHFATIHDENLRVASMPYFGVIEEIWEVNYVKFTVCVFKCKWVDSNIGVQTNDFKFTLVNMKNSLIRMSLSSWQNKLNRYFMFKILVMKDD